MPGRTGSFLWSGEAAGYPEGICVRKSCLCAELSANIFCTCLGEHRPTVVGTEIRDLNEKDPRMKTFGTIDGFGREKTVGLQWHMVFRCRFLCRAALV